MFKARERPGKEKTVHHCIEVRSTEFISKQPCQFFVVTFFVTSVQIQCPSQWSVHDTCIPSSYFAYLLISSYLLRTLDNTNFVRVIGSRLSFYLRKPAPIADNANFLNFSWRFQLSRVDYSIPVLAPCKSSRHAVLFILQYWFIFFAICI